MSRFVRHFLRGESGATAIEYGLIVALIAIAIVAALTALSGQLSATFDFIRTTMAAA